MRISIENNAGIIERLQLRHEMTSHLLPYGKKSRSHVESARNGAAATVVQLLLQT